MPFTRRILSTAVAGVLVAAGLTIPTAAAWATPPSSTPTLAVTDSASNPAAGVAVGDPLTVTATTPITQTGQTGQSVETTWDAAKASATLSSLVTPEGWTRQYTTDGSTWSPTVPSNPATVSGVRATGSVASEGLSGALQVSTALGSGSVITGAAVFSGTSGGDGWDAFDAGPNILNVWHHNSSSYNLDCHNKLDGTSCGPLYSVNDYQTSGASTGSYVNGKVYSMTVENATGDLGVLCTDVSSLPFSSCGFTALIGGAYQYQNIGSQTMVDGRVYASTDLGGGNLLCYDIALAAPCAAQPYAAAGLGAIGQEAGYTINVGGKVFVTASQLYCFDAATGDPCAGAWPVGGFTNGEHSVTPMRDSSGTLTGVCSIKYYENCWDLAGSSVAYPSALADQIATYPVGGLDGYSQFTFNDTRAYWFTGDWFGPPTPVACFDWLTSAACAGFQSSTGIAGYRYALRFDSADPNCLWSNGDNGVLASIDANTGVSGCTDPNPKVLIPYTNVVPRLSCAEAGRVREWRNVTFTAPAGIDVTTLKLTIENTNGFPVSGFVDLLPNASGVVDLSTLSVSASGTQPSFVVSVPGATDTQAADLTASVRYASDPPQLCLNLSVRHSCPVLSPGLSAGPDVAVPALAIGGQSVATVGSTNTATPISANVTQADMSGCVGSLSGSATRTYPGGSVPVANTTLDLLDNNGSTVASTTTAGNGSYSFANVNPAAYSIRVGAAQQAVTVAAAPATASLVVPVTSPTAADVTSGTLQNRATTFAVSGTTDATASLNLSQVKLQDPTTSLYGSSVTMAGEGVWDVTSGGDLRFTPVATFTGSTTPVTYQLADSYGTTATAHASVTVAAVLPTAQAVSATGVQGDTLSLTPVAASPAVGVDASSLRLVDPSTGVGVTSLVVAGVGTYTVEVTTGKISFVPLGGFVGSDTRIFRMLDLQGRSVTSTLTVMLAPFTVTAPSVTVPAGTPATSTLQGVPAGSTVTAPTTVTGAASVTVSGTSVLVVPAAHFSGIITVPVTVVHGTTTVTVNILVMVRPEAVRSGWHTLTKTGRTLVHWTSAPSAARYQVLVNGKVVCTTTAAHCAVAGLLGPKAAVTVVSVGGANLRSVVTRLPYKYTVCVTAGAVHFDTASWVLTRDNQAKIARFAAVLKAQGFTHACLSGYTDSRSSVAYNKALSHARVKSVSHQLAVRIAKTHTQRVGVKAVYLGEFYPAATNGSDRGRAENRRVSLALG